jgi:hypothetical protein
MSVLLALAGCGNDGEARAPYDGALAEISAETVEARRICATITGYMGAGPAPDASAMDVMRAQEFSDCVKAVAGGQPPGPALRGRIFPDT